MGIDYDKYASAPKLPQVQKEMKKYSTRLKELKIILSVDRLDYSKGIMLRLEAFDRFLDKYTEYREKVVMILVAVPSREGVEQYQLLKRELDEHVGRINGKHATFGWMPVWYQYNSLPFHALTALYAIADVALLTPIRDGMNLIAKEFIATKDEGRGVLVLSETAGAAKELNEAIIVNPYHIEKVADSIKLALILPEEEQVRHTRIMQNRLKRYNVTQWADTFIADLHVIKQGQKELHARKLTPAIRERIIKDYRRAENRLFLLDYDGTLRAFESRPELAVPDDMLLNLVKKLADDPKNEVCIISGRDRKTLGTWFAKCGVNLIAEHGVWIRDKNCDWEMIEPLIGDWKDEIRGLMEMYMDRTPGSFIEEKDYSLVWHYRRADPEQASIRANELKDELLYRVLNLGVGVLEGNKVIEVKNIGINKGVGGRRWLTREQFDFVFAAGDDWTDEDLFNVLDDKAYSVKVGISFSRARFTVETVGDVSRITWQPRGGEGMNNLDGYLDIVGDRVIHSIYKKMRNLYAPSCPAYQFNLFQAERRRGNTGITCASDERHRDRCRVGVFCMARQTFSRSRRSFITASRCEQINVSDIKNTSMRRPVRNFRPITHINSHDYVIVHDPQPLPSD